MSAHLREVWADLREAMPSWRAQGPAFWEDYDAVIATDANGRGRNFEVWTYGKSWATRFSLDEAKKSVESIYGPLEWRRVRMPPEVYNHYYFGPTTEFTDPRTLWVVDVLPQLGASAGHGSLMGVASTGLWGSDGVESDHGLGALHDEVRQQDGEEPVHLALTSDLQSKQGLGTQIRGSLIQRSAEAFLDGLQSGALVGSLDEADANLARRTASAEDRDAPLTVEETSHPDQERVHVPGYVVDRLPKLGRLFTFEVDYAYDKDVLMGKDGFPDKEDWSSTVTVEADNEPEARLLAEQMVAARYREPIGVRRVY